MLQEESTGATAQSEYISECLLDGVDLPVGLIASLLRRKLRAFCGQHQSCFLIQGFPADVEQLTEFERKVSNFGISFTSNANASRSIMNITSSI